MLKKPTDDTGHTPDDETANDGTEPGVAFVPLNAPRGVAPAPDDPLTLGLYAWMLENAPVENKTALRLLLEGVWLKLYNVTRDDPQQEVNG